MKKLLNARWRYALIYALAMTIIIEAFHLFTDEPVSSWQKWLLSICTFTIAGWVVYPFTADAKRRKRMERAKPVSYEE